MLVSYTYRSDDSSIDAALSASRTSVNEHGSPTKPSKAAHQETKTFAFYTVVDLGVIVPREERRELTIDPDF